MGAESPNAQWSAPLRRASSPPPPEAGRGLSLLTISNRLSMLRTTDERQRSRKRRRVGSRDRLGEAWSVEPTRIVGDTGRSGGGEAACQRDDDPSVGGEPGSSWVTDGDAML